MITTTELSEQSSSELAQLRQENKELREALAKLQKLAGIDILTELPNLLTFNMALPGALALHKRLPEVPIVLAIGDINGLKAINDTNGHAAGDKAIVEVGNVLANCVRESDKVYRLHGDEFALILYNTDLEKAATVRQRIEEELNQIGHSLAIGFAQLELDDDPQTVFKQADSQMYEYKKQSKEAKKI